MGCCCGGGGGESAKGKKGKVDGPPERIATKFQGAFDQTFTTEDAIRSFLQENLFEEYDAAFTAAAIAERAASLKGLGAQKGKPKKKESEVTEMPEEPTESKDSKKGQLKWDKYYADKKAYEAWALGQARRANIEVGAEIIYPDDLQHLRTISTKTGKPLKVIISKVPEDTDKAKWSDELKPVVGQPIDAKIRKDKTLVPKFKGLASRCFDSVQEELVSKLMALCKDDDAIWSGSELVSKKTAAKMKAKLKEPVAPPGLVNPVEMFKDEKKYKGKYEEYDEEGMPVTKKDGKELKDSETKGLKKQWDQAKKVWDKHQEKMDSYNAEVQKFNEENAEEVEESKKKYCSSAGKALVSQMTEELISKRADEKAAEVNKGMHDEGDLLEYVVQETLEEEEIITDPVLKAFRRVDEEATNSTKPDQIPRIFEALGDDELAKGTHKFYNEISNDELKWACSKLDGAGVVEGDGSVTFSSLKNFIEAQDVPVHRGKPPTNLVSCLLDMKIEACLTSVTAMDYVWSPRTWRSKLGEEFGVSTARDTSPRKGSKDAKKEKKEKKEKEEKKPKKEEEEVEDAAAEGEEAEDTGAASPKEAKKRLSQSEGEKKDKKEKEGKHHRQSGHEKSEKEVKKEVSKVSKKESAKEEPKKEKKEKKEKKK